MLWPLVQVASQIVSAAPPVVVSGDAVMPIGRMDSLATVSVLLLSVSNMLSEQVSEVEKAPRSEAAYLSVDQIKVLLNLVLQLLREKDPLCQDMCSMAICHIYSAAEAVDSCEGVTHSFLLSDYVVTEVIAILTREKKPSQPAGVSISS